MTTIESTHYWARKWHYVLVSLHSGLATVILDSEAACKPPAVQHLSWRQPLVSFRTSLPFKKMYCVWLLGRSMSLPIIISSKDKWNVQLSLCLIFWYHTALPSFLNMQMSKEGAFIWWFPWMLGLYWSYLSPRWIKLMMQKQLSLKYFNKLLI